MSKLHMYRWVGKFPSWAADGDGTLSSSKPFDVKITSGTVTQGIVYEIRQGTSPSGEMYNCQAGASTGGTARFLQAAASDLVFVDADFQGASLALRQALLASEKKVSIVIDDDDFDALKDAGYQLCFAKKVGDAAYNVVWQSYSKYFANNDFSWTPQYQLFGTNTFQEKIVVKASTNLVGIGLGEQATLNKNGRLGPASTGGPATAITMINDYGSVHPGLNQLSTGIDGSQVSTPIYVAPKPIVHGEANLTPVEKVLVWFEQNIQTSTMFSTARSKSVEIDLTFDNEAVRLYKDGKWSKP